MTDLTKLTAAELLRFVILQDDRAWEETIARLERLEKCEAAWMATLKVHWLASIECNHAASTDRSVCACGRFSSDSQPSVGNAVERWAEHVLEAARAALEG